jgi:hypothetical protein
MEDQSRANLRAVEGVGALHVSPSCAPRSCQLCAECGAGRRGVASLAWGWRFGGGVGRRRRRRRRSLSLSCSNAALNSHRRHHHIVKRVNEVIKRPPTHPPTQASIGQIFPPRGRDDDDSESRPTRPVVNPPAAHIKGTKYVVLLLLDGRLCCCTCVLYACVCRCELVCTH